MPRNRGATGRSGVSPPADASRFRRWPAVWSETTSIAEGAAAATGGAGPGWAAVMAAAAAAGVAATVEVAAMEVATAEVATVEAAAAEVAAAAVGIAGCVAHEAFAAVPWR